MSWLRILRRKRFDGELQDEMETFLSHETADNEARGMSPEEARRQARIKLGNPQKVRETLWAQNSLLVLTHLGHDSIYAFRTLRRTPGFSIIAVAVMALVHWRGHIAVHNCALSAAAAASLSRSRPAGDGVRAPSRGWGGRAEFTYNPVAPCGLLRSGARRPTVLKTWQSCVRRVQPDRGAQRTAGAVALLRVPGICFRCWECSRRWAGHLRSRRTGAAAPL